MKFTGIRIMAFISLTLLLAACNLPGAEAPAPAATEPPLGLPADTPAAVPPTATLEAATPTVEPTPTLTPPSEVIITAATGNLNIRRGPSQFYNVTTSLAQGGSATATGRDAQGYWLYIAIPSLPSAYGWISTQTQYSTIDGDIDSLPVVTPEPPMPAYIRNCTFHPMLVNPGSVLLPPQTSAPANAAQFAPGAYTAADQSVAGSTPRNVSLAEGTTVDITTDGLNNVYACP